LSDVSKEFLFEMLHSGLGSFPISGIASTSMRSDVPQSVAIKLTRECVSILQKFSFN